jgi:hypothetical protein
MKYIIHIIYVICFAVVGYTIFNLTNNYLENKTEIEDEKLHNLERQFKVSYGLDSLHTLIQLEYQYKLDSLNTINKKEINKLKLKDKYYGKKIDSINRSNIYLPDFK